MTDVVDIQVEFKVRVKADPEVLRQRHDERMKALEPAGVFEAGSDDDRADLVRQAATRVGMALVAGLQGVMNPPPIADLPPDLDETESPPTPPAL